MQFKEFKEWKRNFNSVERNLEGILLTIELNDLPVPHDEVDETADTFSVSSSAREDILMKDIDTLQTLLNKIKKTLSKQRKLLIVKK